MYAVLIEHTCITRTDCNHSNLMCYRIQTQNVLILLGVLDLCLILVVIAEQKCLALLLFSASKYR